MECPIDGRSRHQMLIRSRCCWVKTGSHVQAFIAKTDRHEPRPTSTLADSNSLLVPLHGPQDRSTVDIKHLHNTLIASGDNQLPILPDLGTSCRILEPGDGLDDLSCPGGID